MSTNSTSQKAKSGPNGETRKRPEDLEAWKLNEKKELIISTARGFFCAIPHYDANGALEFCGADTEFINGYKLREHIQDHHIERKREALKLPENPHATKKKWTFLTPSYHPYYRGSRQSSRQSSIAPFAGQPQSRETSVAVDYSTWGFGDGGMTPMATTYGQAATNTLAYPAPASNLPAPASGSSTPHAQYNSLIHPPSYNPRATPEQLSAELLERLQQVKEMTPQELSESMQRHFPGLPIYPPHDQRLSSIVNAHASVSFGLYFNPLNNTLNSSVINNVQTKAILDPSLITEQPQSASAMSFGTYEVSPYTSLVPTGTQVGPLAPQPLLDFQNTQYAPFAHNGLHQGQIQEYLARIEQNSPFRDPFPVEVFHPDGWVISAHRRAARWGWGYPAGSTVVPMSAGRVSVVAPVSHAQSGDEQEVVLESVEHDDEDEEEYDPEAFMEKKAAEKGREVAWQLEEG